MPNASAWPVSSFTHEIYPRGYTIELSGKNGVRHVNGSEEIASLMHRLIAKDITVDQMDTVYQVVDLLKKYIPSIHTFIRLQAGNPYVMRAQWAFLDDTLRFIATGKRETSLETWIMLIEKDDRMRQSTLTSITDRHIDESIQGAVAKLGTSGKLARAWMRHKDGIRDIIMSLYIFFGPEHKPTENP